MGAFVGTAVGAFVGATVGGTAVGGTEVGGTAVGGAATGAVVGGAVVAGAGAQAANNGTVINVRIKPTISVVFIFLSFFDKWVLDTCTGTTLCLYVNSSFPPYFVWAPSESPSRAFSCLNRLPNLVVLKVLLPPVPSLYPILGGYRLFLRLVRLATLGTARQMAFVCWAFYET